MSKTKLIKASITVFIPTIETSDGWMCDEVSAIFTENLQEEGIIVDWGYSDKNKQKPEFAGIFENYEEGDGFNPKLCHEAKVRTRLIEMDGELAKEENNSKLERLVKAVVETHDWMNKHST